MSDERFKAIVERAKARVTEDGHVEKKIYERSADGMGKYESYFDLLVDRRLDGQGEPTAREVFDSMKAQLNFAAKTIADAEKEYTRLFNEHFDLKQINDDRLKGRQ